MTPWKKSLCLRSACSKNLVCYKVGTSCMPSPVKKLCLTCEWRHGYNYSGAMAIATVVPWL